MGPTISLLWRPYIGQLSDTFFMLDMLRLKSNVSHSVEYWNTDNFPSKLGSFLGFIFHITRSHFRHNYAIRIGLFVFFEHYVIKWWNKHTFIWWGEDCQKNWIVGNLVGWYTRTTIRTVMCAKTIKSSTLRQQQT